MIADISIHEARHEKISKKVTGVVGAIIILLLFINFFQYPDPPIGQTGVLVSFGEPDKGSGADMPDTQQEEIVEETGEESQPEEVMEEVQEEVVEESQPEETEPEETAPPEKSQEVVTQEDPAEVAIKKAEEKAKKQAEAEAKKEADRVAKKKAEAEAKKKAEVEAKKKAEAEAKAKAEADAKKKAEYDAKKKQFGDLFGDGKGETDESGNQGDPNGDPNSDVLEGISTGSGTVGGGLSDRGLVYAPEVTDNTQKTGRVVMQLCVGTDGKVIPSSVKYTMKGSTTTDPHLKEVAKKNALKFKFSKGEIEKQCGTISFDFKVK